MQLIIISGKIGSGKSTLSKCFQKKGYYYINSDSFAKNIIQNNKFIIDKLNKEFDILNNEKKISFLEVSTASEGDLYLLINKDITLSLLDKYFFAVFQYFGLLLMSSSGWYFLFMINFSSKNYK